MFKVSYRSKANGRQVKASEVSRFDRFKLGLSLIVFGK